MHQSTTFKIIVLEDHFYTNKILSKYVEQIARESVPANVQVEVSSYKSGILCMLETDKGVNIAILDYYLTHDTGDTCVQLNGLEIMRFIHKIAPNCKMIMVSALRNKSIVDNLKEEGVFAYIDKHTNSHEKIGSALQEAIEQSFIQTQLS